MSQYRGAWETLKLKGKVVLASPSGFHRRIIRALQKQKNQDIAYKFQLAESNQRAIFVSKSEGNMIKVFLRLESKLLDLTKL